MAIAFSRVSIHSRSKGHSAVAGAAYRAGISLFDERTGETYDFTQKSEVSFSQILLPEGASEQYLDRSFLWNAVERAEKRKDAQLAKDVVLALPKEISRERQIDLALQFAQDHFVRHGLVVDVALHDHESGNPHAHLYVTTRRLIGNTFGQKARDLNPEFAKGRVASQDYWGEKWRDQQNAFFKSQGIELEVDANHLVSQRHEGRVRDGEAHYLRQENRERRAASIDIALNDPSSVLNVLSRQQGVFTERTLGRLLLKNTDSKEQYDKALKGVMSHPDLVSLGENSQGRLCFTTRGHFLRECTMQQHAEALLSRSTHGVKSTHVRELSSRLGLNPEQQSALFDLAKPEDLSILIGRAGSGKSFLMKAAHQLWSDAGYRVRGISVSGIAAKGLEKSSGMRSFTLASFKKQIAYSDNPDSVLNSNDILVMDEAGMTDIYDMSLVVELVKASGAKLVLVGDEAQLQPIGAGAPLRALVETVGFSELSTILRQNDANDRLASQALAKGDVNYALNHYEHKGVVHWGETGKDTQSQLIQSWSEGLTKDSLGDRLILAHRNVDVDALNALARDRAKAKGIVSAEEFTYEGFEGKACRLSVGDRLLFRKNDTAMGVANGEFATVMRATEDRIEVSMNNRKVVIDPKVYNDFSLGYAATVHKSQGITVNETYVYVGGAGWNKHLSYVAMTRHKDTLALFANKEDHGGERGLRYALGRMETKDNVLDFPLAFSLRRGFSVENVLARCLEKLTGFKESIQLAWQKIAEFDKTDPQKDKQTTKHQSQSRDNLCWESIKDIKHRHLEQLRTINQRLEKASPSSKQRLNREYRLLLGKVVTNPKLMETIKKQSLTTFNHLKNIHKSHEKDQGRDR